MNDIYWEMQSLIDFLEESHQQGIDDWLGAMFLEFLLRAQNFMRFYRTDRADWWRYCS